MTTERSTGWTEGKVKEVRTRIRDLDTEAGEISNRLADLEGSLASTRLSMDEARLRKHRLEGRSRLLVAQVFSPSLESLTFAIRSWRQIQV